MGRSGAVWTHAGRGGGHRAQGFERGFIRVGSMESEPITFAGMGEPLLRLDTLTEAARLTKTARHGAQLRLKTSGLVPSADSADTVARLVDAGIKSFSVALNAATPPQ
jgi:MoaA/NifB/PqqE/SkfB family radical SAM enzyme